MPMKVGVRGGFPFATVQPTGGMSGLYVELLEAIAVQAGTTFQIEILPFPRLRQHLKDGSLGAVLVVANSQMLADAIPVGDVVDVEIIALGRPGSRVYSLEGLRGKRICLTRSSTLVPELFADKRYLLREVAHHDSCPKMLDAGRVDFIISMPIGLRHILAKMGRTSADYGEPYVIRRAPLQLMVSRMHADPARMHSLRLALDKAKTDGTIESIHSRYKKMRVDENSWTW